MIKRVQVSDISKKRYLIKKKFLNILSSLREKKKKDSRLIFEVLRHKNKR